MWWLVADTNLEASWAPVHELDRALRLEMRHRTVNLLGNHITAVEQAGRHIFAIARITLDHLVVGFEAGARDLRDRVGFVRGLGSRDHRSVGNEREVDARIGHKVGLELVQVDVEGAVEPEGGGDGGYNWTSTVSIKPQTHHLGIGHTLSNETVEILVVGALNVQVAPADVVDGFIVDHEAAIRVFEGGVGRQDGIVWLHHSGGNLRGRIDTEFQLALLAVVDRQTLHEKRTEARSSSTAKGMEDQEPLQTGAIVCHGADLVQDLIDQLLSDSVVATSVVVGGIFLSCDQHLRVEEGAISARADLVNDIGLEIAVDCSWNIFALACYCTPSVLLFCFFLERG